MTNVSNSTIFDHDVSDGLQFQSASIDVSISKNVVIWNNAASAAVSSTQTNNKLINSGIVYGQFGQGVFAQIPSSPTTPAR